MRGAIERVVVALDTASEIRAAVATAARLAARWKAHLHGIFVEDDDLIRLAQLPFARQVMLGAGVEAFNLQQARRQMRTFAERARLALAAAAKRHGLEWSFEITHDAPASRLGAIQTTDFLICGAITRSVGGHFRVDCRWWSAVESEASSLLLAHRDWHDGGVAVLLEDRKPASERLIAAAANLAEAHGGRLAVICAPKLANSPGFKTWLDEQLSGHTVTAELDIAPVESAMLNRRIVELECHVLALASDAPHARPERLRELVAIAACDVLVVR